MCVGHYATVAQVTLVGRTAFRPTPSEPASSEKREHDLVSRVASP